MAMPHFALLFSSACVSMSPPSSLVSFPEDPMLVWNVAAGRYMLFVKHAVRFSLP